MKKSEEYELLDKNGVPLPGCRARMMADVPGLKRRRFIWTAPFMQGRLWLAGGKKKRPKRPILLVRPEECDHE